MEPRKKTEPTDAETFTKKQFEAVGRAIVFWLGEATGNWGPSDDEEINGGDLVDAVVQAVTDAREAR